MNRTEVQRAGQVPDARRGKGGGDSEDDEAFEHENLFNPDPGSSAAVGHTAQCNMQRAHP